MSGGYRLNLGCGYSKLPGYINCDIDIKVSPDIVLDIRKSLPFSSNSIDTILMSHVLEHIEEYLHANIFNEFYRVLRPEGNLVLIYPEGPKCAEMYAKYPEVEFFKFTLLGRRLNVYDRHRSLIYTKSLVCLLNDCGFSVVKYKEAPDIPYYTVLHAKKSTKSLTYEDILRKEIFDEGRN